MSFSGEQQAWPDGDSPADAFEAHATQRVLDELFSFASQYRSSESYMGLLKFVAGFRSYAPYNAMLVRLQMQGARYVSPAHRWSKEDGRTIKVNARPLLILHCQARGGWAPSAASLMALSLPPRGAAPAAPR